MNLNIFTGDFEYLCTIDGFDSLRWRRQCFDAGEIELHCGVNAETLLLAEDAELFIEREGYDEIAVVEGLEIAEPSEGGQTMAITGRLSKSLMDRATIKKVYDFNCPAEEALRLLVTEQMPGVYDRIVLGDLKGYPETIVAQVGYTNLLDTALAISKASGVLFRLRPDFAQKCLVFETYKGADRSISQQTNPRVVFSDLDGTLAQAKYQRNKKKHRNYAIVAGEGEDPGRVITTVDRVPPGEARREIFIDGKSKKQKGLTPAEYIQLLQQFGGEKLDALAIAENFEAAARLINSYAYRAEWDVGDIVTTHKSAWGILLEKRITECEEVYDAETGEAGTVTPVFGSSLPETLAL